MHLLATTVEGPVSVVGLAARSGRLKGAVSKHVRRLVEAGWCAAYGNSDHEAVARVPWDLLSVRRDGVRMTRH